MNHKKTNSNRCLKLESSIIIHPIFLVTYNLVYMHHMTEYAPAKIGEYPSDIPNFSVAQNSWLKSMLAYLSLDTACPSKLTVSHFSLLKQVTPVDKYLSMVLHQWRISLILLLYGKVVLRDIRACWLVLSWSRFCHTDCFHRNGHKLCIFWFWKPANSTRAWPKCHIINYLLTWFAWAVLENIGPQSHFVRTEHSEVRTATTSGQYSSVWPLHSVSKRLIFIHHTKIPDSKRNNTCTFAYNYPLPIALYH